MKVADLFNKISKTAGAVDKAALLKPEISNLIKQIYEDTYDNSRKYFVKKFDMPNKFGKKTIENDYSEFHDVLNILANRDITGNDAIELVENKISEFIEKDAEILARILDRNLKIGISFDSFNKLLGKNAKKKFEVTLAYNLDKVKGVNPIDGTFYASHKMDGSRCIGMCHKENDIVSITFLSRGNKEFTTLDNVKPALEWYLRDLPDGDYVTDGEICKIDENGNEDFQAIMKELKRKDHTIKDPCYMMFDFCTLEEFEGNSVSEDFTNRYAQMQKMIKGCKFKEIKLLKQERITSQEDFDRWSKYVEEYNWEGFMLRKDVPFETGRTKNLLKVKKFMDDEFVVSDLEIAEMTTAEPGQGNVTYTGVKALLVPYKGNIVRVGSGLTKEQRIAWYKDPKKIIGKTVTVQYFETTKNQNGQESLRFPILKYVYENGRDC